MNSSLRFPKEIFEMIFKNILIGIMIVFGMCSQQTYAVTTVRRQNLLDTLGILLSCSLHSY